MGKKFMSSAKAEKLAGEYSLWSCLMFPIPSIRPDFFFFSFFFSSMYSSMYSWFVIILNTFFQTIFCWCSDPFSAFMFRLNPTHSVHLLLFNFILFRRLTFVPVSKDSSSFSYAVCDDSWQYVLYQELLESTGYNNGTSLWCTRRANTRGYILYFIIIILIKRFVKACYSCKPLITSSVTHILLYSLDCLLLCDQHVTFLRCNLYFS